MKLDELMERISLPEKAREEVRKTVIPEEDYTKWKAWFDEDLKKFITEWKERPDRYRWALAFLLSLSCEAYDTYQERKIADEVYNQTFYDITIWCDECYKEQGVYGLKEVWWIAQSVKLHLYRLGRLQFEPITLEESLSGKEKTISAGTEVLNVHIPAGEPLDYEACLSSFRKAEAFFGKKNQIYVCDSWLLSPKLKSILSKDSNILRFQKLFEICRLVYPFPQAEQRIFGTVLADKSAYPQETQLQRNARQFLMTGEKIGIGAGFIDDIYKYI